MLEAGAKFSGVNLADKAGDLSNLTSRNLNAAGFDKSSNLGGALNLNGAQNGVNFLGVIFAPSKRRVDVNTAREICALAHEAGVKCVGVFAEILEDEIERICEFAGLDAAQIYGRYSGKLRQNLARKNVEIWKVYSVANELPSVDFTLCDMPLFDCKGEKLGGNGVSFDWQILRGAKFAFALAGGIGEENVLEALKFNPRVIDINSKAEDENGIKDPAKIERILNLIG